MKKAFGTTQRHLSLASIVVLVVSAAPDRQALGAANFKGTIERPTIAALPDGDSPGEVPRIRQTRHDLSIEGTAPCPLCHLVKENGARVNPEWDPQQESGFFAAYTDASAPSQRPWRPQGVSLVCLSCHDGMIGPDRVVASGVGPLAWNAVRPDVGTIFSSDHPISVSYGWTDERPRITSLNASHDGRAGSALPLFGDRRAEVECASCHNAHYETFDAFLRLAAAQGRLCTTCHRK
jgi:predicted CXXCH cytochrome family protein